MPLDNTRWQVVTPSQFPHEQEALDFVQQHCDLPWARRAWSNFEFVDSTGKFYEVDLLLLTHQGLFLIEIKSYAGMVYVEDLSLVRKTHGQGAAFTENNPLKLANHKAKVLKGLLQSQGATRDRKHYLPYIQALVFMSKPEVDLRFKPGTTQAFYTRQDLVQALSAPSSQPSIDKMREDLLVKAMEQAGIGRRKKQAIRVNEWIIKSLLGEGPDYQDHLAEHESMDTMQGRIRIFSCPEGDRPARDRAYRAAQREYRLLYPIRHDGIVSPLGYVDHELGPMLTYHYEEKAVRLDQFMEDPRGKALDRPTRLRLLRQLAEVLRYAHARRLIHRALAPQNMLVSFELGAPFLKVMNWHTGRDVEQTTGTTHLEDLVADESTAYMAPETLSAPQLADEACDIFSLGCVGYLLLTGQPPASDQLGLATRLKEHQGLRLGAVLDGAPPLLEQLIREATDPDVSRRPESVDVFLRRLDEVDKELKNWEESDHVVDPFEAAPDERVLGPWLLVRRLGQGAISTAFLVRHESSGEQLVLKLPTNAIHNERLEVEAEALARLDHRRIVKLRESVWVGTRRGLLLTSAGEETLADRLGKEGSLGLELLQRFGDDLLEAAEYLEDQGIAHRDLKPANLGVKKVGKDEALHLTLFDFSLTRERPDNLRVGTPGYRDPFLTKTRPWDAAAERYSLAATLYEMATGTMPQWGDGRSDPALVQCELQVDEERFARGLEEGFSRFFRRALHREARERFPSVEAMRSAWNKLFKAQPAKVSTEPAPISLPEQIAGTLELAETTQEPKLLQAFERLEVRTVEQFVACPRSRIRMLKGLGSQTRKELLQHQMLLESRLERQVEPAGEASVESLVEVLVPKEKTDRAFASQYLGLAGGSSWLTGPAAAQAAQLATAESYKILPRLRKRWDKLEMLRTVCDELVAALEKLGGVAQPAELAEVLLGSRGSLSNDPAARQRLGQAIVRAAVEVEQMQSLPRLDVYRVNERVLVAQSPELYSNVTELAQTAERLIGREPLPTRTAMAQELLGTLSDDVARRWSETRLFTLAEGFGRQVALSSRGEPYPRGLAAERSLLLCASQLAGRAAWRPAEIAELVRSRFPLAAAVPTGQAELQKLLAGAGLTFTWEEKRAAFVAETIPGSTRTTRGTTSGHEPRVVARDRVEEELRLRFRDGEPLVLTLSGRLHQRGVERLTSLFPFEVVSLERELLAGMRRVADQNGAEWPIIVAADAEGPQGPDWANLLGVVDLALEPLEARLTGSAQPLLLERVGLLARYRRLGVVERLMARSGAKDGPPAVWLLVTQGPDELPRVDEVPVPLPPASRPVPLPRGWLEEAG